MSSAIPVKSLFYSNVRVFFNVVLHVFLAVGISMCFYELVDRIVANLSDITPEELFSRRDIVKEANLNPDPGVNWYVASLRPNDIKSTAGSRYTFLKYFHF